MNLWTVILEFYVKPFKVIISKLDLTKLGIIRKFWSKRFHQIYPSWFERGECSKRNAAHFYSMVHSTFAYSRKLLAEKQIQVLYLPSSIQGCQRV
jgi:hypothetical protein